MPRPQPGLTSPRPAYSPIPALSRSPVLSPVLGDGALDPYASWPLYMDFANNRYRLGVGSGRTNNWLTLPGASYARTGEQLCYNAASGLWEVYAANIPPVMAGGGMEVDEGTTNKCTNYNAAPTDLTNVTKSGDAAATLTVVDDTAALIAAGFGGLIAAGKMNGKVYKLDNSAGTAAAFAAVSGPTGNTNTHTISVVARTEGAAGSAVRYEAAVAVNIAITSTTRYARFSVTGTPGSSSDRMQIRAAPGSVVYFILNQLEEKAYATNPVIVAHASASRGNAAPVVTGLASLLTPPFTLVAVANLSAIDGVGRTLACLSDGTSSNRIDLRRTTANTMQLVQIGGTLPSIPSFANKAGPRLLKSAVRVQTDGSYAFAVDGAALATGTGGTPPPGLAQLNTGNLVGPSTWLNSPLLFVGIAPDLTDAQLQALTASNGLTLGFA